MSYGFNFAVNIWYITTEQHNAVWFFYDVKNNATTWTQNKDSAHIFLSRRSAEQFAERFFPDRKIHILLEKEDTFF